MKDLIEQDAKNFGHRYAQRIAGLSHARGELEKKLIDYPVVDYRTIFLSVLLNEIQQKEISHSAKCKSTSCNMHRDYKISSFTVKQAFEQTLNAAQTELTADEVFSVDDKIEILQGLREMREKLSGLGNGQEILFEEIDSLKEHFSLGKKNWDQLLKGKLLDLIANGVLDRLVAPKLYEIVSLSAKAGFLIIP